MILITGATGNIGRELIVALEKTSAEVRLLVRDPARIATATRHIVADLDDPTTLPAAFGGVEALFLLTPGIGLVQTENAVAAAQAANVRHIVHLSSSNVLGDPMPAMGRWHHDREELVRASGIPATILRPGAFMTNALDWLPTIRAGGFVLDPIGCGRYAPIDPADIADVAAVALTEEGHEGKQYVLTGDEALTVTEQTRMLAAAIGRHLDVRPVTSPEEAVRARFPHGAPPALAAALIEGFALMRADTAGFRTDTIHRMLGRPPRSFTEWCTRNAHRFVS
ncbi:NAD(P)H-binding protein [Micromonospora sp. NPDC005237]|uniref:NAD(P)H-binding protein n=1 Tax=Micromonospora sp. NPDC005237 TaxID=3155113 RepID=UPI0033B902DB